MRKDPNIDPQADAFNEVVRQALLGREGAPPKPEPERSTPPQQRSVGEPAESEIQRLAKAQKQEWGVVDKRKKEGPATLGGPVITRHQETITGFLLSGPVRVAERSFEWTKAQVHTGLQDFVSRVLYGEAASPEPGKDHERDHEKGLDR
jgi:hypothetical protein